MNAKWTQFVPEIDIDAPVLTRIQPGEFATEASDLGWKPGCWYSVIKFAGKQLFGKPTRDREGDIEKFVYRAVNAWGVTILQLTVYND